MPISFLNNETLKHFVLSLEIDKKVKDFLVSKIPEMDGPERVRLFKILSRIYLLSKEEKKEIEKVKKFWKGKTP